MSLMSLTAVALGKKVQAGEVTVEEAVLDALEQIEKKEELLQRKIGEKDEKKQHKKNLKRSICHVNGVLYRIYNTGIDR